MVLQRDQPAMLWGWANPNEVVHTAFGGRSYQSIADADGLWRQQLPPQSATKTPSSIVFTSASGETATLNDVLFGDVYICGGQSNMQFTVSNGFNATAEIAAANNYPDIRVTTVGQGTTSYTPLTQLATIAQPWTVANASSIGVGNWSEFSAVCWFFGRDLHDALGGSVPIGLISNNWGGTRVEAWSSPDALKTCNASLPGTEPLARLRMRRGPHPVNANVDLDTQLAPFSYASDGFTAGPGPNNASVLWNAMIVPYTVGPMALKGFTWFQGEQNSGNPTGYACTFPAMIQDWRAKLQAQAAWFGFVLLEPWIGGATGQMRDAQQAALRLPAVSLGSAIDIGDPLGPWGSVHPRHKQPVGQRLALGALALNYNQNVFYQGPTFQGATASVAGTTVTVTVSFTPQSVASNNVLSKVPASCPINLGVPASQCAFPTIFTSAGAINATSSISSDGTKMILTGTAVKTGVTVQSVAYGYGQWPIIEIYNAAGIPIVPFNKNVTASL